ncbi:hypothetical protein HOC35_07320 [Candidatus Woesearchaeota archaeon]|jgi:hypothetical protein|nr:hypothetical protein [Candidatus Woesearchaeota archaeon]
MIKKLLITSIALYVAFAGIRGCQAVRSPETKQVISYLESTAYLGQKVNEDHPEFFHEIKKDSSLEDETENIDDLIRAKETGSALRWGAILVGEAKDRRYSSSIKTAGMEITSRHPTYFLGLATQDKEALKHIGNIAKLEPSYEKNVSSLACKVKRSYIPWKTCK